ncbi:MAG: Uncharacterized protein G01um101419_148 [Parcubacteria group bacterium Gr01-1014_19]|nr:MAG: Uncharacterized protein G01um101419_148 [Parcubacteria group bacterium Gr01-1014_19]
MKTLGEFIRELRDGKDLSLREFGEKLGDLSAAFLSDIELGRRYPSDEVLADMARVLGISLEKLKEYDNRPPIEGMKEATKKNPGYGLAFRKVIDEGVTPEELIKLADKARKSNKN